MGMRTIERERCADVRIWVVATRAWEPESVFDEPPTSDALFPALDRVLTREEAAEFVAGFNEQMLAVGSRRWAVARLVVPRADEVLCSPVRLEDEPKGGWNFAESSEGGVRFAVG
jgi:hypothetical protein